MAAAYVVTLPASAPRNLQDNVDMVVVYANDSTDAIAMAKAAVSQDANILWDLATATAIAAAANWIGFRFVVIETYPNGSVGRTADLTATGAGQDTLDEIGTALATALGGGAAYTTGTQVLLLTAAGLGNNSLELAVYPPLAQGQSFPIPGIIASKVDNGVAGAALSFTFAADAYVIPNLVAKGTVVR